MQAADIPGVKFPIPWANSAGGAFIRPVPIASQIGTVNGAASFTDGFPPDTFTLPGAGGYAPDGRDMNGALNEISAWSRWHQAGGAILKWDAAFSSAVGGYPRGAVVASSTVFGRFWICLTDNNGSNPDAGGVYWQLWPTTQVASSRQQVFCSGTFNLTNGTGFIALGSPVSFTFPDSSPTTQFMLHIKSILRGGANTPLSGTANSAGMQQAQITSRVRDLTFGVNLIPEVATQYVAFDMGGGFDFAQQDFAGSNPIVGSASGPGQWTYDAGSTISIQHYAQNLNTGAYPIVHGVSVVGTLILTAVPAG